MKNANPISKPKTIHCGQILYQVITVENEAINNDKVLREALVAKSLKHAKVRRVKVKMTQFNESETGLIIQGLFVDKDSEPLFKDKNKLKDNLVEDLKIPFDQENVPRQPGVYFDEQSEAQTFAKDINISATAAASKIKEAVESIIAFNEELIEKGC